MSVYARLGFNYSDPATASTVSNYSSNVANQMSIMPPLLSDWQIQDLSNSNVNGYFVNPVANVTIQIKTAANTLLQLSINLSSSISSDCNTALSATFANANTIYTTTANSYLYITNRQSNVVPPGTDTTTPHYTTCVNTGKVLSYILNQTDGIQNNSVIMGNFTSVTLGNTLNSLYSSLSNQIIQLQNSITSHPTMNGTYYTTNLSLSSCQTLQNTVVQLQNLMYTYPIQDTQFYANSQIVLSDYSTLSQFSKLGQTENYLLNNYIGTPKLISRIG
jgi:hypothetical protein